MFNITDAQIISSNVIVESLDINTIKRDEATETVLFKHLYKRNNSEQLNVKKVTLALAQDQIYVLEDHCQVSDQLF